MKRLFLLEIKRIFKSRQTIIMLCIGLVMAVIMGISPVSFESVSYEGENGSIVRLTGLDAIEYKQMQRCAYYGKVTPANIMTALKSYQNTISEVGLPENHEDFPLNVYTEKISPILPLISKLSEMYGKLQNIDINSISTFYAQTNVHLADFLRLQYDDNSNISEYGAKLYSKVETPFAVYGSFSRDAFDYIILLVFLLLIICVAIAVPTFSENYENGSDSIFRCAKYGRSKLAFIKIGSLFLILTVYYTLCMSIQLAILNFSFGTETLKTSVQMLFSAISLVPLTLVELQMVIVLGGLISILASVSFTLFVSSKVKKSLISMLISVVVALIPTFVFSLLANSFLFYILPSAGIGLSNNFLYQLVGLNFLELGNMVFWTPHIIVVSATVWIFVYVPITIMSYCKNECS